MEPARAGHGGRDDKSLCFAQPLPAPRVQRRPTSRQLPVSRTGSGDLSGLWPYQALHQRRSRSACRRGSFSCHRKRWGRLPCIAGACRLPPRGGAGAYRGGGDRFGLFYQTVYRDAPMTITPAYASAIVRRFFDARGPLAPYSDVPREYVIMQRINLGLYAGLGSLNATANWRRIAEQTWPFRNGPPSTPTGQSDAR